MSTEYIVVQALSRGLALADFEILTIGMIIDIIIEHDNLSVDPDDDSATRIANQNDMNSF